MTYIYPDKGDRITCCLIEEYDSRYWQDSESQALKQAVQKVAEIADKNGASGSNEPVDKGHRIKLLDLGCGMGRLFQVFAGYVDEIIGVEPDEERFKNAYLEGKRISGLTGKHIEVINRDLSAIQDSKRFKVIISSHVFQHISIDMACEMMESISRHLEDGGILILTTTYIDGDEDKFFVESLLDGKRLVKEINEDEFGSAMNLMDMLPVRMFSPRTIIAMAESSYLELNTIVRYHYKGHSTVLEDRQANHNGDGDKARDCLYIFTKEA